MKKILTTAAIFCCLSSNVAAGNAYEFYLFGGASASKLQNHDISLSNLKLFLKNKKFTPNLDLGLGFNLTDSIAAELAFSTALSDTKITGAKDPSFAKSFQTNAKTSSSVVMARGIINVLDFGLAKFFIGGGAGWSYTNYDLNSYIRMVGNKKPTIKERADKSTTSDFAYELRTGTAIRINRDLDLVLSYSWRDLGTIKQGTITMPLRSHNVGAAIKINL